jgi:organic hydroperoxide reductase OsmC/OhrA
MNPRLRLRAHNLSWAALRKLDMTHEYHATVEWQRQGVAFVDNRYSRDHVWRFDGGAEVPASSAPSSVALPFSVAAAVDPEEALVAAVSTAIMLFFLSFAANRVSSSTAIWMKRSAQWHATMAASFTSRRSC